MVLRAATVALLVCVLVSGQGATSAVSTEANTSDATGGSTPPPETPPPAVCPAGGPVGAINLTVKSPQEGDEPLPFRTINRLGEGNTMVYSPVVRGREKRAGQVALVMVPLKRSATGDSLIVTDPVNANENQEWKIPQAVSIVAYVYGPEGLSKKKVRGFLAQDDLLIAQLADYAAKTAQTEALIEALSSADSSAASVNAALSGFASQYGTAIPIDKTAPPAVQASALFSTLNPQLATYDPLSPSASARIGQTASLTTAAATLFFGSPIGLAAGGTAMLLDLRSIAFPGTQFRSSFAEPLPHALNLCGQRNPAPPHTRVAYIWANRIPNAPAPEIEIGKADYVPQALKTAVPVTVPESAWRYLDRAREWTLEDDAHHKYPLKVLKLANQKSLELDLTKTQMAPGQYRLTGYWDWDRFEAKGNVFVRALTDFAQAAAEPASQDKLLAKSGKTVVTLQSSDFEFVNKVELKRSGDEFATAMPVPFVLPRGVHEGPQDRMDVQVNTTELEPGDYQLLLSQDDGKAHPVNLHMLPNPPQISNLPVLANQGVAAQHYVLKGERLELLTRLESPGADLQLEAPGPDGSQRNVTVQLKADPRPGTEFPIDAYIKNRNEALSFSEALKITGPLPTIASSKLSLPADLAISILPGEFPAGSTLTAVLDVKNSNPRSVLTLGCAGEPESREKLRIGAQTEHWSLQQLSPDQLFISYDTSALPSGCSVEAAIDNGPGGKSQPYTLARILRLPQIDQFTSSPDMAEGKHVYSMSGRNLEMIEKVGWDQLTGVDVTNLPTPIPGQGQKQSLRVLAPDQPTPSASLFVWLRGEKVGRPTTITSTISQAPSSTVLRVTRSNGSAAAPVAQPAAEPDPTATR